MKYLSLFSGIGGFELGLLNSNYDFECVGYSEIDKYARSIYERNFPEHINFGDATKIETKDLPDFDFLVGGFPCQAFSLAGKRRGFNDTRGTLFFEIARILKDKRPRYFLLENVKGLLSHDKGKTFKTILEILSDLRYDVRWKVYNSKDYGVPQNRERVFIEGYSRRECSGEVLSPRRPSTENIGKVSNTWVGVRTGRLHCIDEHMNTLTAEGQNSGGRQFILEKESSSNNELVCLNKGAAQAQKVYDPKGVAPTLSACGGGDGGKTGSYIVPDERKIKKEVNLNGHQSGQVYSDEGLSPTLSACDYKAPIKIADRKINVVANFSPNNHGSGNVLDPNGLGKTVTATDYKHPMHIIEEDNRKIKKVGNVYNGSQLGNVYDSEGLSPTMCAGHSDSAIKIMEENNQDISKTVKLRESTNPNQNTNFEIEECIGSTQKHSARTDGTYSPTLTEAMGKGGGHIPMLKLRESTKKGYKEAKVGDGVELSRMNCTNRRGVSHEDATGALNTDNPSWGTITPDYRIRKLTPRECERLQAFPDDWTKYGKDGETISNTQRYKCCGNAVTTTVITAIVNQMFEGIL